MGKVALGRFRKGDGILVKLGKVSEV